MSKYIFSLVAFFIILAFSEINAQNFNNVEEHFNNFGDTLNEHGINKDTFNDLVKKAGDHIDSLGENLQNLGLNSDEVKEALNHARHELGLNSSAQLGFSFVTIIMSLFHTYIVA